MKLSFNRVKNLSYVTIENFFSAQELQEVLKEVAALKPFSVGEHETLSARENNKTLKTGGGIFLDKHYANNRSASPILQVNRKIFNREVLQHVENFEVIFKEIIESTVDNTLVNYYSSGQEYKPHVDSARITVITFLKLGEFSGGDFLFPEQQHVVKAMHNMAIIFPSIALHAALPIQGEGTRVSIAQFITREEETREIPHTV